MCYSLRYVYRYPQLYRANADKQVGYNIAVWDTHIDVATPENKDCFSLKHELLSSAMYYIPRITRIINPKRAFEKLLSNLW